MQPGIVEASIDSPGGGIDGGRGRPFNSPQLVARARYANFLMSWSQKVLQLVLVIAVGVVSATEATATCFHAQTEWLYRLLEVLQ